MLLHFVFLIAPSELLWFKRRLVEPTPCNLYVYSTGSLHIASCSAGSSSWELSIAGPARTSSRSPGWSRRSLPDLDPALISHRPSRIFPLPVSTINGAHLISKTRDMDQLSIYNWIIICFIWYWKPLKIQKWSYEQHKLTHFAVTRSTIALFGSIGRLPVTNSTSSTPKE